MVTFSMNSDENGKFEMKSIDNGMNTESFGDGISGRMSDSFNFLVNVGPKSSQHYLIRIACLELSIG